MANSLVYTRKILFFYSVLILLTYSKTTLSGFMISNCASSNQAFLGIAFHGPIAANGNHNMNREFANCRQQWDIIWLISEQEKVGNIGDWLSLSPMRNVHKVAVPGHGQEDAPNGFSMSMPGKSLTMPIFPPFFQLYKQGLPASHTYDTDFIEGSLLGMSNNLDIGWYMTGLFMHHYQEPWVVYYGEVIAPNINADSGIVGVIAGEISKNEVGLAFAVFGMKPIKKATLSIGDKATIMLDTSLFTFKEGITLYVNHSVLLDENKVEDIFNTNARINVVAGEKQLEGVIRLRNKYSNNTQADTFTSNNGEFNLALLLAGFALFIAILSLLLKARNT